MSLHKDQAIILSARVYGESDKIMRFFTFDSGKLTGIAKGGKKSQKRFMNTLELFNHVNIEYFEKFGKGMVRIDNADLRESNSGIESSFKKMCIASFLTEFVDKLTKEKEKNEALFDVLRNSLKSLKTIEFTYSDVLYYQLQMLDHLGYMPNLKTCVHCNRYLPEDERVCFSREKGGTLCAACSRFVPHKKYPAGHIPRLAGQGEHRADEYPGDSDAFERVGREILEDFVSFHLNVEFKSYRLLRSVT